MWLVVLESLLKGEALSSYWTLILAEEREEYDTAKAALLQCAGVLELGRLDQVGIFRRSRDESFADIVEESCSTWMHS